MSFGNRKRTKTITAQNTFTDPIFIKKGGRVRLSGTFTATVSLQIRDVDNSTWADVTDNSGNLVAWTTSGVFTINPPFGLVGEFRVGIKTGGYTSGTIVVTLEGR